MNDGPGNEKEADDGQETAAVSDARASARRKMSMSVHSRSAAGGKDLTAQRTDGNMAYVSHIHLQSHSTALHAGRSGSGARRSRTVQQAFTMMTTMTTTDQLANA